MKINKILVIIFILISFSFTLFSQNDDNIIRITNTDVIVPDSLVIYNTPGQQRFIKLIIKNDRKNSVKICNIKTPEGFLVSVRDKLIQPLSQTQLFIGIDPKVITDSIAKEKIIIETNLIIPITINIEAKIKK